MNNSWKYKLAIIGFMLAVTAFVAHRLLPQGYHFSDQPIDKSTNSLIVTRFDKISSPTAALQLMRCWIDRSVEVSYRPKMLENSTEPVSVKIKYEAITVSLSTPEYPFNTPTQPRRYVVSLLPRNTTISLAGPALNTNESKRMIPELTETPHVLEWLVTPSKRGQHLMNLDISDFIRIELDIPYEEVVETQIKINGKSTTPNEAGVLRLPVEIITIWFVSERTFLIIRYLVGLVAFLLMCPAFIGLFKRKPAPVRSRSNDTQGNRDQ